MPSNVLGFFLNPWMLVGLSGIVLPVIAHLISRRQYDLVYWGAMQFLELDPSAKRRIRLEELLLLLIRMGLVALIVVALARPWLAVHWLTAYVSTQPRDVVIVIDGSYSMNWQGQAITPHVRAIQLAREFLSELRPGDSVQIMDARETARAIFPDPTRDLYEARQALNDLPEPSGTANLAQAVYRALQILSTGTQLHREVVVLTDGQAHGWRVEDESLWAKIDDVLHQAAAKPRVWVVDAASDGSTEKPNDIVERLNLSRELAVVGVPIRLTTRIKSLSGDGQTSRKVYLEVDGQRIGDQTRQIRISHPGEATVDFEYRFESAGSHLVSVLLDDDLLPNDNRADAVVTVMESLDVLLVDGDRQSDPTRCETYFANAALRSTGGDRSWITATVITPEELNQDRLKPTALVVLANVASLDDSAISALQQFVASGHGLLFTLGDHVEKLKYHDLFYNGRDPLLPCRLDELAVEDQQERRGVRVASGSLELPWLRPFRSDQGGVVSDARWSRWWKVVVLEREESPKGSVPEESPQRDDANESQLKSTLAKTPVVEARLTTGDPLIVTRRYGRGQVALFASSLDADWNTLPAKQDYVPFLHELLFSLVNPSASRNVDIGQPLLLAIKTELKTSDFQLLDPLNHVASFDRLDDAMQSWLRVRSASLPGVYRFVRTQTKPNEIPRPDCFAVNFDRSESDLTRLTDDQRETLARDDRLKFVENLPELRQNMFDDNSRSEYWWLLIYAFLFSMIVETWMTRRMIRRAYAS